MDGKEHFHECGHCFAVYALKLSLWCIAGGLLSGEDVKWLRCKCKAPMFTTNTFWLWYYNRRSRLTFIQPEWSLWPCEIFTSMTSILLSLLISFLSADSYLFSLFTIFLFCIFLTPSIYSFPPHTHEFHYVIWYGPHLNRKMWEARQMKSTEGKTPKHQPVATPMTVCLCLQQSSGCGRGRRSRGSTIESRAHYCRRARRPFSKSSYLARDKQRTQLNSMCN